MGSRTYVTMRDFDNGSRHSPIRITHDWREHCSYSYLCYYNDTYQRCAPKNGPCWAVHNDGEDRENCTICMKKGKAKRR